ncbi:hypothetical protein [Hyphomicrobium sp.]|uniref:hypothetical protein n=1 Tax=Hyphomicrobium sp. TaxID=82 RepID=UPI000FB4FD38|nr:hypothetical protein [Hyphomicrobium sp.]MBN9248775.1 hypothetical protein [Hyphomicrobium sp.]RUP09646.1 MAG: hypothetical protein EKK38_09925 [Hyphomicrobium sp.]
MSIETLMSAANAAGYVMAAEEQLPETFGAEPQVFEFKSQPPTAIAIWRPVVPAVDGKPLAGHISNAWDWFTDRFVHHGATPA